jgi:S1-C subfamily serine protease
MPRFEDQRFEFSARDLSFFDRARNQLPDDARGALVVEVKDGGWAALGQLQTDDIIESVAGRPVADSATLGAAMRAATERRSRHVVLGIRRGIRTLYLELEPVWESVR